MFLLCSIILTLICLWFTNLAAKTRLDVCHRVLHIRYVVITVAYSITAVFLFSKILQLINWLLSISFIRNFLFVLIPPSNVSAGFYWIISLICCLFLLLVYCLIMWVFRFIWLYPLSNSGKYLESKSPIEKGFNFIAGWFYEIKENRAILPHHLVNAGAWISSIRRIFGVILLIESLFVGVYLQMDWTFINVDMFSLVMKSLYMIPVLSYIVLHQVELFLAADREKDDIMIDTEELTPVEKGDYSVLVGMYKSLFEGEALITNYRGNGKNEIHRELFSGVGEEQRKKVDPPELLDSIVRDIVNVTAPTSHFINGLVDLINGNHLAVFDTPWGEFDVYYLAYIQHMLDLSKKALVICDTKQQVQRMKARYVSLFKKMNSIYPVWRIKDIETMNEEDTDILICTEEEFFDNPLNEKYPSFYEKLKIVVMLDVYGILCREAAFSSRLFDSFIDKELQFIFYIPENNTDLRNELQEKLNGGSVKLCETTYANEETDVLLWRAESIYKPQEKLSTRLCHDFGVAYTIGIIAGACDVASVYILSSESIPTKTYFDLVTREYSRVIIDDYTYDDSVNFSTIIKDNDYSVACCDNMTFSIVYDTDNNLLNVFKTWISYGGTVSSMLHIVSQPYMLRDYFAFNMTSLCAESTGVQLIVPGEALMFSSAALSMLIRMRRGVTCSEIMEFAREQGIRETRVEQILRTMLEAVLGRDASFGVYDIFSFGTSDIPYFNDNGFLYTIIVKLTDDVVYNRLCKMTEEYVRLTGAYNDVIPVHKNDVSNYYLSGQRAAFGGVRYLIDNIRDGVMQLKREETVEMESIYTIAYNISSFEKKDGVYNRKEISDNISTEFFEVDIERTIAGYYESHGMLDFAHENATVYKKLDSLVIEKKTVPCLELSIKTPEVDNYDKVANTLCFLLKGAMETFLPKNHKDLLIFSDVGEDKIKQDVKIKNDTGLLEDPIPSDILEGFENGLGQQIDANMLRLIPNVPKGVLKPNGDRHVYLYIAQFSVADTGALTAITNELNRIFLTIMEYLNWSERQKSDIPLYLRMGYKRTPDVFDTTATAQCLASIVIKPKKSSSKNIGNGKVTISGGKRCSFCGKPVSVTYTDVGDGRIMCRECSSHRTNTREEIEELLKVAKETLEKKYNIRIPERIKVSFKGAGYFKKNCDTSGGGRVLGYYEFKRCRICVERGGPKACVLSTLMHELTHAWQHENLGLKRCTDINNLSAIEGHASYVEVECLKVLKQRNYAGFMDKNLMASPQEDPYGAGYRYWKSRLVNEEDKNIFHHIESALR